MAAKLANYLQKTGKKPLLAACDIYRPAAIKQLQVVGQQVNVPVYEHGTQDPVKTALEAVEHARSYGPVSYTHLFACVGLGAHFCALSIPTKPKETVQACGPE